MSEAWMTPWREWLPGHWRLTRYRPAFRRFRFTALQATESWVRGYEGTTSGTTILAHWTETETLEAYERYVVWIVVMWIKKTQKSWKHSYLHTLHTPAIAWTFNLQHIVYTTRCMSLNCRNHCRKCHNILCDGMLLLAGPIIVKSCYYCIKIFSPCVCDTSVPRGVCLPEHWYLGVSYPGESFASGGSHSCLGKMLGESLTPS